jgi:hypothetical protein
MAKTTAADRIRRQQVTLTSSVVKAIADIASSVSIAQDGIVRLRELQKEASDVDANPKRAARKGAKKR